MSEEKRRICHVCAGMPREYFCGVCDEGRDYDALAAQRDELMQARNGLVENNDALHMQLAELRAQRDEGLAREAEAQRTIELYVKGEASLREENEALQQRLAEAEKLPRAVTDVIEIAKKIEKQAFAKGVENFEIGTFSSLAYALKRLASPGCADGEKAE